MTDHDGDGQNGSCNSHRPFVRAMVEKRTRDRTPVPLASVLLTKARVRFIPCGPCLPTLSWVSPEAVRRPRCGPCVVRGATYRANPSGLRPCPRSWLWGSWRSAEIKTQRDAVPSAGVGALGQGDRAQPNPPDVEWRADFLKGTARDLATHGGCQGSAIDRAAVEGEAQSTLLMVMATVRRGLQVFVRHP